MEPHPTQKMKSGGNLRIFEHISVDGDTSEQQTEKLGASLTTAQRGIRQHGIETPQLITSKGVTLGTDCGQTVLESRDVTILQTNNVHTMIPAEN